MLDERLGAAGDGVSSSWAGLDQAVVRLRHRPLGLLALLLVVLHLNRRELNGISFLFPLNE